MLEGRTTTGQSTVYKWTARMFTLCTGSRNDENVRVKGVMEQKIKLDVSIVFQSLTINFSQKTTMVRICSSFVTKEVVD
jgi:hypothetical protein